ncbi:hypothetical protein [Streptomyces sp. WM6368]|uniref:hypothetical protein n=1 Tax=Streptomyces sp. WM6368 TaxID=1415554 RepID=UPI0006AF6EE0|nr:hypothetical protein [Streptomyces sp. WM6368]KOU21048.1 hypothetical protein ADK51_23700 [Streptomyces sp. WM6368]
MPLPLIGLLLLLSLVAVPTCIVLLVLMLRNPPRSQSRICAVLALILGFSATAVYCYGWFSVTLGGPFPEVCEDDGASGARLASLRQEYWPLRNTCIYADGSTVEHLALSINLYVYVLAGLAVVLTCAAVLRHRRARLIPAGTS